MAAAATGTGAALAGGVERGAEVELRHDDGDGGACVARHLLLGHSTANSAGAQRTDCRAEGERLRPEGDAREPLRHTYTRVRVHRIRAAVVWPVGRQRHVEQPRVRGGDRVWWARVQHRSHGTVHLLRRHHVLVGVKLSGYPLHHVLRLNGAQVALWVPGRDGAGTSWPARTLAHHRWRRPRHRLLGPTTTGAGRHPNHDVSTERMAVSRDNSPPVTRGG